MESSSFLFLMPQNIEFKCDITKVSQGFHHNEIRTRFSIMNTDARKLSAHKGDTTEKR